MAISTTGSYDIGENFQHFIEMRLMDKLPIILAERIRHQYFDAEKTKKTLLTIQSFHRKLGTHLLKHAKNSFMDRYSRQSVVFQCSTYGCYL